VAAAPARRQRLDLTAKEFNLLALLLRRRGQILSRTTLAEQVWDMNFDSDTNVVEVAVRRLRAKLDDPFPSQAAAHRARHGLRARGAKHERPPGRSQVIIPACKLLPVRPAQRGPCTHSISRRLSRKLALFTMACSGACSPPRG
jgi:hypothetical protein